MITTAWWCSKQGRTTEYEMCTLVNSWLTHILVHNKIQIFWLGLAAYWLVLIKVEGVYRFGFGSRCIVVDDVILSAVKLQTNESNVGNAVRRFMFHLETPCHHEAVRFPRWAWHWSWLNDQETMFTLDRLIINVVGQMEDCSSLAGLMDSAKLRVTVTV